jgi:hypothetical protein
MSLPNYVQIKSIFIGVFPYDDIYKTRLHWISFQTALCNSQVVLYVGVTMDSKFYTIKNQIELKSDSIFIYF